MGIILKGMSFSKQYSVKLDIRNRLIHFPDVSLQLGKANGKYNCDMCKLRSAHRIVLPPYQQITVPLCKDTEIGTTTGIAEATPTINRKEAFLATLAPVKL